ncbi:hypothetical protein ABZ897_52620 [Nonomuraea sp. NPDC046802]|uniref:hypothetical protein n=1 Tax=Nonomuraea sp. NPDC046802 TaxID=3154919 RepID=UPI0034104FB9
MTSTPPDTLAQQARTAPAPLLRLGLLSLVAIGIAGAAAELAFERHWRSPVQFIPWAALVLLALGLVLLLAAPRAITAVRVLAAVVLVVSAYGVFTHVSVNFGAGPSDPEWDALSSLTQWWYALTKTVGSAPPLAPGMLAQGALLLLLTSTMKRQR